MMANELILDAEYADIVITLLKRPYSVSSLTKLIFISFCVKNENSFEKYHRRTKDLIDAFISNVSLKLSSHSHELKSIVRVIHLLNKTRKVIIAGDDIKLIHDFNFKTENAFLVYCETKIPNPIEQVNRLDRKALLEEILRYV
jgi:hypothetical protein